MYLSDFENQKPADGQSYVWFFSNSTGTFNCLATDANHYFKGYFYKDTTYNSDRWRVGSTNFFNNHWRDATPDGAMTIPPSTTIKFNSSNSSPVYVWGNYYKK